MKNDFEPKQISPQPDFVFALGLFAIIGCVTFAVSILIADFVVPDHDWISDTISDLGAGRYEFIVDVGIYAFSASLVSVALLASHMHLGGWRWSAGVTGLALLALIVFLVGARNEYGDDDSDGVVIHSYLVYALGLLMAFVPWAMSQSAGLASAAYGKLLVGIAVIWTLSAPVYFILPTEIDGLYERYLGLISLVMVIALSRFFIRMGRNVRPRTQR